MAGQVNAWHIFQIGAREHYAIPRALLRMGRQVSLTTDVWVRPAARHCFPQAWRSRWHAELANLPVTSFNLQAAAFEVASRFRKSSHWERIMARNAWFSRRAAAVLRRQLEQSPERPIVFSFSYAARDIFSVAKRYGCRCILGQIDPGPAEVRLVEQLAEQYGDDSWHSPPQAYWDLWREECDLADRIVVNSPWSQELLTEELHDKTGPLTLTLSPREPAAQGGRGDKFADISSRSNPTQLQGDKSADVVNSTSNTATNHSSETYIPSPRVRGPEGQGDKSAELANSTNCTAANNSRENWHPSPRVRGEGTGVRGRHSGSELGPAAWKPERSESNAGDLSRKIVIIPLAYEGQASPKQGKQPAADASRATKAPVEFCRERPLQALYLGQVILRKGVKELAGAIRELASQPVSWTIIGGGPENLMQELRDCPHTDVLGQVSREQVADFYRQADVFLLPTHSDGFAITQLEAAAYGLPIIASRHCGAVVEDGVNGIVLPTVTAAAIANAVRRLLVTPDLLPSLRDAQSLHPRHTVDGLGRQLHELEQKLLPETQVNPC